MFFSNKAKPKPQPSNSLLAQVSPGIRAGELWHAYLRWAGKTPGYFGEVLKTAYQVTADYDLFACHTRLGLPIGLPPILGRFKALECSRVGLHTPKPTETREKAISGPAMPRLRLNRKARSRLGKNDLTYFNS